MLTHPLTFFDRSKSSDIVSNGVGTLANLATSNPSAAPYIIGIGVGLGLGILTVKFLFGAYKKTCVAVLMTVQPPTDHFPRRVVISAHNIWLHI